MEKINKYKHNIYKMEYETYEDLNKVKEKIMYLMKLKYGNLDENQLNDETNIDTKTENIFQNVLRDIRDIGSKIYIMTTYPKEDVGGRRFMFRSTNAYSNFSQYANDVRNMLDNVIKSLKEIMSNIGYVEPDNINQFYNDFKTFSNNYIQLKAITYRGNRGFSVVITGANNDGEKQILIDTMNNIEKKYIELGNLHTQIKNEYNYKTVNKVVNNPSYRDRIDEKNDFLTNEDD